MAKMRVHELAKELNIQSKDIVAFLASNGVEGKSAQSSLEDDQIAQVKKQYGPKPEATKPSEAAKPAAKAPAASAASDAKSDSAQAPKKKKTFAVFNAQYSSNGNQQGRPQQGNRPQQANRPQQGNSQQGRGIIKPRVTPTAVTNVGMKPDPYKGTNGVKAKEAVDEKKAQNINNKVDETSAQPAKNNTNNANSNGNSNGSKGHAEGNQEKSAEQRGPRILGNISNTLNEAKKPQRPQGNGQGRPQQGGQGKPGFNGQPRPQGNGQGRPQQGGQGKPGFNGQGRPQQGGQNRPANNQMAAPVPEGGKNNTKGHGKKDSKGNRKDKDFEKNGKTENFLNLEKQTHNKSVKAKVKNETEIRSIAIPDRIVIRDLADQMHVNVSDIVKKLFLKGNMVTPNHEIDFETAEEIAAEYNCIIEHEEKVDVIAELLKEDDEDEKDMVKRPPVVCVMGHVDHGKTSLLDAIRDTKVTDREAGGITQHIGAYTVPVGDSRVTFLDTPGHEAFTAMRMRGANSTDIAILVVAADDGVMPQTVEAINHAKAAGVEIIVAINKIDKPGANIDRVKQELSEYELLPEDWGGSTVFVPVSAKTREGIDELLDMLLLTADVLELKANPKRNARGLVIEAKLDKGRGVVATVLVQKGTLHVGDFISAGASYGRVRAMLDDNGHKVKEADPSTPVEILGFSDVPNAGEIFVMHDSEKDAKSYAQTFISENKNRLIEDTKAKMSLDDLFTQIKSGNLKELDLIVKADVQGSVEAVKQSLEKLSNDEVMVKVIHGGVGTINESDVTLASASNAIIIGFNVKTDNVAKATADREGVDLRLYKVIYNAIEDVEAAMKGMLDPIFEEKIIGHGEIRQIFKASGVGNIAGSYVLDGVIQRGCKIRLTRDGEQIFDGPLASLKRFKDDAKEVKAGYECGIVLEGFPDVAEMDQFEAYTMVEVPR